MQLETEIIKQETVKTRLYLSAVFTLIQQSKSELLEEIRNI